MGLSSECLSGPIVPPNPLHLLVMAQAVMEQETDLQSSTHDRAL
ncbi:MAG: hypothetical protein AAF268_05845 [Cyanobacteria bacterium P01_A01_bin.3]